MGDETKLKEFDKGNTKPLSAPLKPTTADAVKRDSEDVAKVPASAAELPRTDRPEDGEERR